MEEKSNEFNEIPKKIHEQKKTNTNTNTSQSELNQILTSTNIDLSEIEATEENLQNFTLSKQFLKIDLDKIREIIEIMEEHCQNCIEKKDIDSAKKAKQRIILLKKIEKEKMIMEAQIIYSNQRDLVQEKLKEELDNYLSNMDQEYQSLTQSLEKQKKEMDKLHQEELDEFKKIFEQNYNNQEPKPSKESLNWMKIKEYALKQNKFNKAQEAEREINKLKEKDSLKFMENKESKYNAEISKIMHRHENENNGFNLKKKVTIEEFNKNKNDEIEKIKKKYEAKLNELKNYQNFEISNFEKITKGVIKPCARIQSIVSSTNGVKDEDEKENEDSEENKEELGDGGNKDEDKAQQKEVQEENEED